MGSGSPPSGGTTPVTHLETLTGGILTSVHVFLEIARIRLYDTFVACDIVRAGDNNDNRIYHVGSDFLTQEQPIVFPCFLTVIDGDKLRFRIRGDTNLIIRFTHHFINFRDTGPIIKALRNAFRST